MVLTEDNVSILEYTLSHYGQASALKVADIFKVFGTQNCLIVA